MSDIITNIIVSRFLTVTTNEAPMKINTAADVGKLIRAKRKTLGMTQTELAQYSGCSLMFLSDLENGKPTIQLGKALQVIHTLGIDLNANDR